MSSLHPARGHRVPFEQALVETLRTGAALPDIAKVVDTFVVFGAIRIQDDELDFDRRDVHVSPR